MNDRRKLYTYTVSPKGVVARITADGQNELRFQALISRNDGCSRQQEMVVRDTLDHPSLVDDVQTAMRRNHGVRLVVDFVRGGDHSGAIPSIRTVAIVESIAGIKSTRGDPQMDLFA